MGKSNMISSVLVLVVILMIVISTYLVINYTTGVLNAAVSFASSGQIAKIEACGVVMPAELIKLRDDIPSLLLPAIYVGFPGLTVVLSILMYIAGYYHGAGGDISTTETITVTGGPSRTRNVGRSVEKTVTEKSAEED